MFTSFIKSSAVYASDKMDGPENSPNFKHVCEMAGRDHAYVRERIRKKVLRDKGWNVDVKIRISSPRRRKQMRNINKKHLTGNAYYASKRSNQTIRL